MTADSETSYRSEAWPPQSCLPTQLRTARCHRRLRCSQCSARQPRGRTRRGRALMRPDSWLSWCRYAGSACRSWLPLPDVRARRAASHERACSARRHACCIENMTESKDGINRGNAGNRGAWAVCAGASRLKQEGPALTPRYGASDRDKADCFVYDRSPMRRPESPEVRSRLCASLDDTQGRTMSKTSSASGGMDVGNLNLTATSLWTAPLIGRLLNPLAAKLLNPTLPRP